MKYQKRNQIYIFKAGIIVFLGLIFVSCNSKQHNYVLNEKSDNHSKNIPSYAENSPTKVVESFMSFIDQGRSNDAMNLFLKYEFDEFEKTKTNFDEPQTFDWAKFLGDRKLSLKRILDEKIEDNRATVKIELYAKDLPRLIHTGEFHLKLKENSWRLISFKLDKGE